MHCCHATYILKAPRDKALQQQAVVGVLEVIFGGSFDIAASTAIAVHVPVPVMCMCQ
jgi:hypothetical protein